MGFINQPRYKVAFMNSVSETEPPSYSTSSSNCHHCVIGLLRSNSLMGFDCVAFSLLMG